ATDFSVCAQQLVVAWILLVKPEQFRLLRSCFFAFRTDIAPPKRRRFHYKKMDRTARGYLSDERDVKRGQGRNPENRDALRNRRAITLECVDQSQSERRLMLTRSGLLQLAPKDRLPFIPLACVPIQNHLRAKDEVLVENVSDSSGQLIGAQFGAFTAEIIGDRSKLRTGSKARKIFHDPPRHYILIKQICRFGSRESILQEIVKELLWKRKLHVRANAMACCDLLFKPAAHAIALHEYNFRQERRAKWIGYKLGQLVGQPLKAVAGMQGEAGMGR